MTYLIESKDGTERQRVESLAGHKGWKVIARNVPHPPHDHHHWDKQKRCWVEDTDTKAAEDRRVAFEAMSKADMMERIEALEARLTALEGAAGARKRAKGGR